MEVAPQVQLCALCRVARLPLFALVHEGEMHSACRTCWCLQQTVSLMTQIAPATEASRVLEDAAVAIYGVVRESVAPTPVAPILLED